MLCDWLINERLNINPVTVAFIDFFQISFPSSGFATAQISGEGSTTRGIGEFHKVVAQLQGTDLQESQKLSKLQNRVWVFNGVTQTVAA